MKFAFIASKEVAFPVLAMCKVFGVTRSGFYAWRMRPKSARAKADDQLVVDITATHDKSRKRYGSPRIHRALRKKGIRVGAKRIARLMRAAGIVARQKRRFRRTTDSNHANPIAPNVLARDFEPAAPNQAWAGDVTYIETGRAGRTWPCSSTYSRVAWWCRDCNLKKGPQTTQEYLKRLRQGGGE